MPDGIVVDICVYIDISDEVGLACEPCHTVSMVCAFIPTNGNLVLGTATYAANVLQELEVTPAALVPSG